MKTAVKNRQKAQYGELYSKCIQLKLLSADGKEYNRILGLVYILR